MIGKTISHYRIPEELGGGGMVEGYRAEETKLSRYVALGSCGRAGQGSSGAGTRSYGSSDWNTDLA